MLSSLIIVHCIARHQAPQVLYTFKHALYIAPVPVGSVLPNFDSLLKTKNFSLSMYLAQFYG